jgi:hypothetical protein
MRLAAALAALIALDAGHLAAQGTAPARRPAKANASVGADWLDVHFPSLPLANTGCGNVDVMPDGKRVRWYQWHVTAQFPEARYPNNHFMAVYVFFGLPDTVALTDRRLDSALAATSITVDEAIGEPAIGGSKLKPERAWARREPGGLHLRVEGRDAVTAFLRARTDSVAIGWCQRDDQLSFVNVPLKKQ